MTLLNCGDIYGAFIEHGRFVSQSFFFYGVQIGAWVSSAFLLNRLMVVFFWDGFIGGISDRPIPRLPKDVTAILIFLVAGLIVASTVFNKDTTKILAASGVVSIVIGLALRTVILDLFMGLAIHLDRPFKMGDWIMIHQNRKETHIVAEVIETNWRTTRLRTTRNNMVVIPNSKLGETIVTNYMEPKPHFRMELDFMVDFEVASERAIRVLTAGMRAACENEGILNDPEPEVRMKESTLEGMVYELRYFILPKHISPNESLHVVNRTVLDHMIHSGVMPAHSKEEVFLSRDRKRSLDMSQDKDLYQLLERMDLFSSLAPGELEKLIPGMAKCCLDEGQVLYRQEDVATSMFVCLEGLLGSYVGIRNATPLKTRTISAGQYFGEGAMLGKQWRDSTVSAATEVLLYEIKREDFEPMLACNVSLQRRLEASESAVNEDARLSVEKFVEEMKPEPQTARPSRMRKVMNLWSKRKKSQEQAFFTSFLDDEQGEKNNNDSDDET
ncbi:MAG: mechanosensitive ion channel [Verrucomicrobiaceae bacterium]|nr:mechanosensitive ion channel [Verrucomicrobiaceae bacterium]